VGYFNGTPEKNSHPGYFLNLKKGQLVKITRMI